MLVYLSLFRFFLKIFLYFSESSYTLRTELTTFKNTGEYHGQRWRKEKSKKDSS